LAGDFRIDADNDGTAYPSKSGTTAADANQWR
jgi:hypothetical protein